MIREFGKDRYSFWQSQISDDTYKRYIKQRNLMITEAENRKKLEEILQPAVAAAIYDEIVNTLK